MKARFLGATATLALAFGATPSHGQILASAGGQEAIPSNGTASAASEAPVSAGTEDATASDGLAEIVVTAQHRSENLQRAAVAVAAISADDLVRANVTQPAQLTTLVPALQIAPTGGTSLFYLRGVGTIAVNAYSDPAIAFNYDGVYIARPSSTSGFFYDLERVEVLKGPQGTLYGRNATGGAINVLPAKPKIGETTGSFTAAYGNYDAVNLQASANLGISDSAALRIAGTYNKHDGYLSDGTSDENGGGARAQLLVEPASDLTIRLTGDYFRTGGVGGGATLVATVNPFTKAVTPSPFGNNVGLYDPQVQSIYPQQYSFQAGRTLLPLAPYAKQHSNFWGVSAEVDWRTDLGTLTFIPAYRDTDYHSLTGLTSFASDFNEHSRQTSIELRLASPDTGPLRYLLGGYYFNERTSFRDSFMQQTFANFQNGELGTRSFAAFGRLTWAITDTLRLSGGLRYTHDRKTVDGVSQSLIAVCIAASCPNGALLPYGQSAADVISQLGLFGPFPSPNPAFGSVYASPAFPGNIVGSNVTALIAEQSNSKVTYRAGIEWDAGPHSLLYATYETGYRGGGFSFANDVTRQQYRPETIEAYTVGSKNRFFDNRLQLNLEAFYWKYKDQQVAHLGVDSLGNAAFFTENVGNSRNYGAEVEAQFLVSPNTLLKANVQYLNAKYTSFVYRTPSPPPTRCATSGPVAGAYSIDCSGLQALRSPKWTMVFGAEQTIAIGGDHKIVLQGNARYQSSSYVGFELLDIERQRAFWSGDATATFSPTDGSYSVSGFVTNIGNQRPYADIQFNGSAGMFAASRQAPRTYGLRLSVQFR